MVSNASPEQRCGLFVLVAVLLVTVTAFCAAGTSQQEDGSAPPSVARPDAASIRAAARDILADPRYAPRTHWTQWLVEKLAAWRRAHPGRESGWWTALAWVLGIWGVLTLIFILAHMGWTLATLLRTRMSGSKGASSKLPTTRERALSREALERMMREYAGRGAFRQALGAMMSVLLRNLEELQILRLHPSKTNGDYVREYPPARSEREAFREFVGRFDAVVYGGASFGEEDYGGIIALFQRIETDARIGIQT